MKIILLILFIVIFSPFVFGQETENTTPEPVNTDYLKLSKRQRTAARILLGGGSALFIGGIAIAASDFSISFGPDNSQSSSAPTVMLILGGASILASIPLYISANKNRRNYYNASLGFKMEPIPSNKQKSLLTQQIPALSLKIPL